MDFIDQIDKHVAAHGDVNREHIITSRLLFRTSYLIERQMTEALKPFNLTMHEYMALAIIMTESDFLLKPSELSIALNATRVQMTRLMDTLENRGLAKRLHNKEDRRSLTLKITPKGIEILDQIAPIIHGLYKEIWDNITDEEMKLLSSILYKVYSRLA